jgi:hypothetical protein
MIALFDLSAVQRSMVRFDVDKLNWLNQQYLKVAPASRFAEGVRQRLAASGVQLDARARVLEPLVDAFRERAKTLREMAERVHVTDDFSYEAKAARNSSKDPQRSCCVRFGTVYPRSPIGPRRVPSPSSSKSPRLRASGSTKSRSRSAWRSPATRRHRASARRCSSWGASARSLESIARLSTFERAAESQPAA